MILLFSADQNWGLGYRNQLLFRSRDDMRRFREMTTGKVVVMGHNTLLSLPGEKPLPNRTNLVMSRQPCLQVEGAEVVPGIPELLRALEGYPKDSVFVIGGEQVYRQLLPYSQKAYVTRWDAAAQADCWMENLDRDPQWSRTHRSPPQREGDLAFTYDIYERNK